MAIAGRGRVAALERMAGHAGIESGSRFVRALMFAAFAVRRSGGHMPLTASRSPHRKMKSALPGREMAGRTSGLTPIVIPADVSGTSFSNMAHCRMSHEPG